MSYHRFKSEDGMEYGSFEVFYEGEAGGLCLGPSGDKSDPKCDTCGQHHSLSEIGWYWWPCFPGCMPDGDPQGPYESEQEAIEMAQMEA